MRVNLYAEENDMKVEIVHKGKFYGIRFYLKSHEDLHHTPEDDDRSAVTFWGIKRWADTLKLAAVLARDWTKPDGQSK